MMSIFKFFVFAICVSGIIFVAEHSVVAQSQKFNPKNNAFEVATEQPSVVEVPISKKQVIITVVVTATVAVCDQFRRCSNVLNIFRGVLGGGQPPTVSPSLFNRSRGRLPNKRGTTVSPF